MLQLIVPGIEKYDEINNEFIITKLQVLQLEHSLLSISKWESKWCKPFLNRDTKTVEESIDYIRCMNINSNVNPSVYDNITSDNLTAVSKYIELPMTATYFDDRTQNGSREIVTSEVIYYWMITLAIPFECQKWHLNRLIALIRVCSSKNAPPKRVSTREIMNRNSALNAARRSKLNNKG